nr:MAG TPA: dUTPase [Caudoviricetes sp.]
MKLNISGIIHNGTKNVLKINNLPLDIKLISLDLKIKLLTDTAKIPHKAHTTDACFDIYADTNKEVTIEPHQTVMIHTGLACEIPHGFWMAIFARSGLASKQGLRPAQGVPVIDEPYRGEIMIPLHNDSNETRIIHHGDRICQFTLLPYFDTNLIQVDELSETDRSKNGFGSTGMK